MKRLAVAVCVLLVFGALRLPAERAVSEQHHAAYFREIKLGLNLREQIGQLGFLAALSGFRSLVADLLFIKAHVAWERTEWGRVALLFNQVTTLQPRALLFWDMAAWHMAWNASVAAMNDKTQPREALRRKAQREYFDLGRDFLERGIKNNPDRPQLYEALGRLYKDKYNDHEHAAEFFGKAAEFPTAPGYNKRFAAYELSYLPGHEREAYARLHKLYRMGEGERLPTLISRLKYLENQLDVPASERIPDSAP